VFTFTHCQNDSINRTETAVRNRFSPDVRQCFFQDEVVTDHRIGIGGLYRHRYTLSNCYWQATVSNATEECHCKIWNYGEATQALDFCAGENLTCFKEILHDFSHHASFTDNRNRSFPCLNDCESYTHTIRTNTGIFPNSETFLYDVGDYCAILDKMTASCKDVRKARRLTKSTFNCSMLVEFSDYVDTCTRYMYYRESFDDSRLQKITGKFLLNNDLRRAVWNYTSVNVALLRVYFDEINVERLIRKESYTVPSFTAAVGGLLGLAMGVSLVTVFETGYLAVRVALLIATYAIAFLPLPKICARRKKVGN